MADRSWDDDTEFRRAVWRSRLMVAVASCCWLVVVGFVLLAVFGTGAFVTLVDVLDR
ncbi:hypothetical protein [Streptomyces sp. 142MFCol3.1]|uniref:hypothetical protein n=1 Tax=Streptomyces sp. 142MFCol3.1 TaxID=1172179 RepID=UPI00040FFF3C|nr:hypothetical protein [Streptomyces sp. 142MFCol3.1]